MSSITKLKLKNFKSFESTEINILGKINLIMGENSSGKSSIIKSILSLKQTLSQSNEHEVFAANGEYVELGTYNDYVYQHNDKNEIGISFTIDDSNNAYSPVWWIPYEAERYCVEKNTNNLRNEIGFTYDKDYKTSQARLKKISFKTYIPVFGEMTFTLERMKTRDHFTLNIGKDDFEKIKKLYIKYRMSEKSNSIDDIEKVTNLDYSSIKKCFRIDKKDRLELEYKENYAHGEILTDIAGEIFYLFNEQYIDTLKKIESCIYYLGPIRSSPLRSYKRTSHNRSIGINGVHSASVLANLHAGRTRVEKNKLNTFNEWVNILFPGTTVNIESYDELVKLKFTKITNRMLKGESIPDVGFGFSQILPFLIQAAVLEKDNILIIEQPELHLHPSAQFALARIICSIATKGIKLIIETHSEHILRGLQLEVSKHRINNNEGISNNEVNIIYVGKSNSAKISNIEINEFGEIISDWPSGFFDAAYSATLQILKNKTKNIEGGK
jgi:predicted ATPase